jgi:hypothetical protein
MGKRDGVAHMKEHSGIVFVSTGSSLHVINVTGLMAEGANSLQSLSADFKVKCLPCS